MLKNRTGCVLVSVAVILAAGLSGSGRAVGADAGKTAKGEVIRHEPIDGSPYVSNAPRWKKLGFSTRMIPWEGEHIVFMTTVQHSARFKPEVIKGMVRQLDQAWGVYAEVIPAANRPKGGRLFKGKGVIAATPGVLAGAIGLGAIGAHGIEVTTLYTKDYGAFVKHGTLPDYYIYEMGRNWFTFGEYRYALFKSSFAVHMGMFAVNNRVRVLNGKSPIKHDLSLLKNYVASDKIDFNTHVLQNHGYALKELFGTGDRNNLYGMIMYELEREYGGEFLKRFYTCLVRTPSGYWPRTHYGGLGQVVNWIASASYGAKENLAERFVKTYHVPLSDHVRRIFKESDWSDEKAITQIAAAIEATSSFAADGRDNDAIIPAKRDAGWVKRHEQKCRQAAGGNVDLLMIGDSITDGWQWRTGTSVWKKYYANRKALNLGFSGDRTQHALWRLQNGEIAGIDPAVTVVMIGTNNAFSNKPAQTAAGVTAIVTLLRKKLPRTKVVLLAIFPRGNRNDWLRARNNRVNEMIAQLADGKHVFFEDINRLFLKPDGSIRPGVLFDGVHPSTKGYQMWAEAMEPTLTKFLGSVPKL